MEVFGAPFVVKIKSINPACPAYTAGRRQAGTKGHEV